MQILLTFAIGFVLTPFLMMVAWAICGIVKTLVEICSLSIKATIYVFLSFPIMYLVGYYVRELL